MCLHESRRIGEKGWAFIMLAANPKVVTQEKCALSRWFFYFFWSRNSIRFPLLRTCAWWQTYRVSIKQGNMTDADKQEVGWVQVMDSRQVILGVLWSREHTARSSGPPGFLKIFPSEDISKNEGKPLTRFNLCNRLILAGSDFNYTPEVYQGVYPGKMVGQEDDPFLLGVGNFSGEKYELLNFGRVISPPGM